MIALRQLDAIMHNRFRNDPVSLAAWTKAKHVESGPYHNGNAPVPPVTPAQG